MEEEIFKCVKNLISTRPNSTKLPKLSILPSPKSLETTIEFCENIEECSQKYQQQCGNLLESHKILPDCQFLLFYTHEFSKIFEEHTNLTRSQKCDFWRQSSSSSESCVKQSIESKCDDHREHLQNDFSKHAQLLEEFFCNSE
ncbi:unnamed protein product [Caenorhabditis angaria]|uniref:DUF19 domain-containing protein n=1 Tax=Caenorhabditis angaria TaxID=860376 RepID=A0A9P1IRG4_9PELO|nr:unnamed protein product [Caenorhabditis angaria]